MPEISRFYGIIIRMYFQDYNPPHFHAEYQGMKAEYAIGTLDILVGKMPRRANALILEWASKNRVELMNNWHKAIIPESMNPIEPLK
ncbi:DUF4160 domain-containing protein [Cryomorpha ignava]|uniref:DUF4160 domain-containing protein n=1 Tax=Cryomorpha ignava TaxID=101383 RepID=A0A7K3WK38_9FLAO|nr:DUF4160 domain-containing protein [Cryomorpha ignava]NEN22013.1 DUF4160 domain-containing protein [Cryomorpha ignava]